MDKMMQPVYFLFDTVFSSFSGKCRRPYLLQRPIYKTLRSGQLSCSARYFIVLFKMHFFPKTNKISRVSHSQKRQPKKLKERQKLIIIITRGFMLLSTVLRKTTFKNHMPAMGFKKSFLGKVVGFFFLHFRYFQ